MPLSADDAAPRIGPHHPVNLAAKAYLRTRRTPALLLRAVTLGLCLTSTAVMAVSGILGVATGVSPVPEAYLVVFFPAFGAMIVFALVHYLFGDPATADRRRIAAEWYWRQGDPDAPLPPVLAQGWAVPAPGSRWRTVLGIAAAPACVVSVALTIWFLTMVPEGLVDGSAEAVMSVAATAIFAAGTVGLGWAALRCLRWAWRARRTTREEHAQAIAGTHPDLRRPQSTIDAVWVDSQND